MNWLDHLCQVYTVEPQYYGPHYIVNISVASASKAIVACEIVTKMETCLLKLFSHNVFSNGFQYNEQFAIRNTFWSQSIHFTVVPDRHIEPDIY